MRVGKHWQVWHVDADRPTISSRHCGFRSSSAMCNFTKELCEKEGCPIANMEGMQKKIDF